MVLRVFMAAEERSFGSSACGGLRMPMLIGSAILLLVGICLVICFLWVDSKLGLGNVATRILFGCLMGKGWQSGGRG